jgi:DNA-binding winged helix-turn-helix (wHTH) protein/TolB-like protein/Flp pilus assembly protein TadD
MRYYDFGNYRLDVFNRELLSDGKHIPLTQKCFEILFYLIEHRDRMLKKDEILNVIWTECFVEEANLAQHIYMIRKVLKENGGTDKYIETIPKFGYRFVGTVSETVESLQPRSNGRSQTETRSQTYFHDETIEQNGSRLAAPAKKTSDALSGSVIPPSRSNKLGLLSFASLATLLFSLLTLFSYQFWVYFGQPENKPEFNSVAILPFKQIGKIKDEKLGLGLADTLISKLSNQKKISISPTSTIIKYIDDTDNNPIEIGEKLKSDYILTGTIQRDHQNVRVNVQMIDVKRKTPLWSDKFDARFSDMFTLHDKICEHVAQKLSIKLNKDSGTLADNTQTENIEAYQAYTLGLFNWDKRTAESLNKAAGYFELAIEKDPNYSIAHALLSDTYSLMVFFDLEENSKEKYLTRARKMGERAMELNPRSSEALTSLALIALFEKNANKALHLYKKAIEMNPHNVTARQRYAWMLTYNNDLEQAIEEMKFAQQTQPRSRLANSNLAYFLYLNKKPEEALAFCKRAIALEPAVPETRIILAQIYEQLGEHEKAITELEEASKKPELKKTSLTIMSRIQAKQGNKKKAIKTLEEATRKKPTSDLDYDTATAYLYIGDKKQAVRILSRSKKEDLALFTKLANDYNLDPLRKMPEFNQLMSKIQSKDEKKQKDQDSDDGA